MLYFDSWGLPATFQGGEAIVEVFRRAGSCLVRKQWLFLYPLTLSVVSLLAFFAIYSAEGDRLSWSAFFTAHFNRTQYIHEHFIADFSFSPNLWVPIAAALGFCVISALIQAPFFRAIAGYRYPLAPRTGREAIRLFMLYALVHLLSWLVPLLDPGNGPIYLLVYAVVFVIFVVIVFADYSIVFEDIGPIHAVRRSLRLVRHRAGAVVVIMVVLQLIFLCIHWLYGLYYQPGRAVFYLLPISQILVETLVHLFATILFLFLYEELRRQSPPRAEV